MAWRVSCAVLCATAMLERPTAKVSVAPMNSSARPAAMRLEAVSEVVEEIVRAVMNTLRGDPLTSCRVAGLLTCGSLSFGGLPGFPVAKLADALSAHSCGGSHGFGPDWVVLTVFPVRPEVRLAPGTTHACSDRLTRHSQLARAATESRNDTLQACVFTGCQPSKPSSAIGF
jgi:hypothetical protein